MQQVSSQSRSLLGPCTNLLILLASACAPAEEGFGAIERPNVILISLDTLRADYLGCYGFELDTSPAIDSVAAQGVRFQDVTSAAPWTLPSHASLLSGLYPSHHGVTTNKYRLESPSLPKWFKQAGYRTMAIHNANLVGHPKYNLMEGVDQEEHISELTITTDSEGRQRPVGPTLNSAKPIIDLSLQWLDERDPLIPFFLFLHFYDAHTDFTPDKRWRDAFVKPYAGRLNGSTMQIFKSRSPGRTLKPKDAQWLSQMYAAEIRTLDEQLKRFFEYLDRTQLSEQTLLLITSDHGEEFMEHGGVLHGRTHYQELLHIPLILRGPGIPVGKAPTAPAHLIDVAPTLLGLAGLAGPSTDGLDLSTSWRGTGELPTLRYLYAEADHNNEAGNNIHRMLRLGRFKLHYDTLTQRKQLYDLERDPGEQNDLSGQQPEQTEKLWQQLEAFMQGRAKGQATTPASTLERDILSALGYGEANDEDKD